MGKVPESLFDPERQAEEVIPPTNSDEKDTIDNPDGQEGEKSDKDQPQNQPDKDNKGTENPTGELYELPDGRKVDASTLTKEWKENFLPEFTRRSQKLKEYETNNDEINKSGQNAEQNGPKYQFPWQNPDWVPQTTAELLEAASQKIRMDFEKETEAAKQQEQAIKSEIDSQLTELKAKDSTLNEESLFKHANKYGFTDLRQAYQNMQDIKAEREQVIKEAKTAKDERKSDGISGKTGAGVGESGVDYGKISSMDTYGLVQEHMSRMKGK